MAGAENYGQPGQRVHAPRIASFRRTLGTLGVSPQPLVTPCAISADFLNSGEISEDAIAMASQYLGTLDTLDSPHGSQLGYRQPSTGGGHGGAASPTGDHSRPPVPAHRASWANIPVSALSSASMTLASPASAAKATPLARTVAARVLLSSFRRVSSQISAGLRPTGNQPSRARAQPPALPAASPMSRHSFTNSPKVQAAYPTSAASSSSTLGSHGPAGTSTNVRAASNPLPSPPPFVAKPVPAPGLVYFSPGAPKAMRRSPTQPDWSMDDYTVTRQLYKGYASAATCCRSGQDVVLKTYTLSTLTDFLRNQVLRELDIHARLDHPGIVQMLAAFREGDVLVLVLEYVRGGPLDRARRKLGGRMTEQQALDLVMLPLLQTLRYLHGQNIIHRDIKPENLLFTPDWQLKVCDYGVSICLNEERAVTRTGSKDYMAPEVHVCPLKRTPADNKDNRDMAYDASCDIWSLGALAYEMLVGFTPFPGGPPSARQAAPAKSLAFPSGVSADARAFVMSCLEQHPGDRPSICQLLQHRWILGSAGAE
ncbi:Serine/threonine-protein kinase Aurora-3 [Tetrabaena socialis]|uniref:Serine/threonine-protein kinase Aurora-3 n=1 Tax=Tetrabaena socialis TaxID=47790 RepID=A0A2J8A437_9CHLO|nr:Serine/threonine-protein kinase Aurora-3 [Tetrabaena socialis]|eukprot:PNH07268.1 Serine/threonine-protein kinase Aurora-3 [Tetrabaena socialis]